MPRWIARRPRQRESRSGINPGVFAFSRRVAGIGELVGGLPPSRGSCSSGVKWSRAPMKPNFTPPPRVYTRLLVTPDDVAARLDGFEVIGTFNPAAIEFQGGVALLIRVV